MPLSSRHDHRTASASRSMQNGYLYIAASLYSLMQGGVTTELLPHITLHLKKSCLSKLFSSSRSEVSKNEAKENIKILQHSSSYYQDGIVGSST